MPRRLATLFTSEPVAHEFFGVSADSAPVPVDCVIESPTAATLVGLPGRAAVGDGAATVAAAGAAPAVGDPAASTGIPSRPMLAASKTVRRAARDKTMDFSPWIAAHRAQPTRNRGTVPR